ncbi:hypothetical protein RP300_00763 [Oligella urethralis]|uniref:Uncharacterized protein n=2 Tax=Oligella urethralis TaxID=90245 RepID=A0A095Z8M6_9BURK|nr:hypothetical protein HMPREF2130_04745 [Oligella urethralis DNF00040]WOS37218.1 hypothetical protein RP300_00763 [Oligella urethralis]SPY08188.1 Uncharacterised protein [Oligella urethralis]SUA55034.1 Uncharacterised protein [Oligella urethralis]SUA68048.1 Uncharacterised protein [Oligella urethralis]
MQKTPQYVSKFVRLFIFLVFFILTFLLLAPIYSWLGDLFLAESVLWFTIKFGLGDVSYFGFLVLIAINLIPALVSYKLFLYLHSRKLASCDKCYR